jgi:radical SAM protein with 4Fe4S-binding SPASM domain
VIRSGADRGDAEIVEAIPCSIGYIYARVQASGDVIPCCKAAGFSMGNVRERTLEEIWGSPRYQEFRQRALSQSKADPYFRRINCHSRCDNLGHILAAHEAICELSDALAEDPGEDPRGAGDTAGAVDLGGSTPTGAPRPQRARKPPPGPQSGRSAGRPARRP